MTAFSVPANLAFDDYTDLTEAIADWMDRSDLTGSIQAMIALAEARMRRELTPVLTEVTAALTVVEGVAALPDDFSTLSRVHYDDKPLPQLSVSGGAATGSRPLAYTIEAGSIRVWPSCDCTILALYQPRLPQLSEAEPTNTILDQHPDLYFFGAMLFAEGYVANDSRAALFKGLFDEALESAKAYYTRVRFAGPLVPRVGWLP